MSATTGRIFVKFDKYGFWKLSGLLRSSLLNAPRGIVQLCQTLGQMNCALVGCAQKSAGFVHFAAAVWSRAILTGGRQELLQRRALHSVKVNEWTELAKVPFIQTGIFLSGSHDSCGWEWRPWCVRELRFLFYSLWRQILGLEPWAKLLKVIKGESPARGPKLLSIKIMLLR